MYILVRERGENGDLFSLHDLRSGKDVVCDVDFAALSCKDLAIHGNLLFAHHLESRAVKVFDIGTGAEAGEIALKDVLGLSVDDGKVYAWNIDDEVFLIEYGDQRYTLRKVVTSRKDINFLKVIRNSEEKFSAAVETFNNEVCLLTKLQEVTRINVVKASRHRLIGATKKHLYLFAEDTNDIVDYHHGEFATLFNTQADSDFCWWRSRVCCGKMYAFYTELQLNSSLDAEDSSDESRSDDESEPQELWKLEIIETDSGVRKIIHLGFASDIWHVCATDTC